MNKLLNKIKKYFNKIKVNFNYKYNFLKVLNSPFKKLQLKWYFGEIKHGTPYFLPRKWVKCDLEDGLKAWDKLGEHSQKAYLRSQTQQEWIEKYTKSYTKPIPIKYFGWHFTSLGWKTKWDDYRFEWSPSLSIVIFGKQLFISILPNIEKYKMFNQDVMKIDCYWESWLHWEYNTDKNKSKEERFKELVYKQSNTWGSEKDGWTDYYYHILNKKYLKLYEQILENRKSNN